MTHFRRSGGRTALTLFKLNQRYSLFGHSLTHGYSRVTSRAALACSMTGFLLTNFFKLSRYYVLFIQRFTLTYNAWFMYSKRLCLLSLLSAIMRIPPTYMYVLPVNETRLISLSTSTMQHSAARRSSSQSLTCAVKLMVALCLFLLQINSPDIHLCVAPLSSTLLPAPQRCSSAKSMLYGLKLQL